MDFKLLDISVKKYVATLGLARTESLNALDRAFAGEITAAVRELNAREDVRVIILTSKARAFCAGLDLKDFLSLGLTNGETKNAFFFQDRLQALFDCCNVLEEGRKPVIAAVHGMCVGGGLDMIAACDIRLCSEDASFSLRETAMGLVADMGVLQRLPFIIGQGRTREMAYTARFYSAKEAKDMGLVNAVYSDRDALLAEAEKLAGQIAANGPLAVMGTKEVLNYSRTAPILEGMDMSIQKNALLVSSKDAQEALAAFSEKRKPNFKGE